MVLNFEDADGAGGGSSVQLRNRYLHGPAVDQILAQENVQEGINDPERVAWFFGDNLNSTRDLMYNDATVAKDTHGYKEPRWRLEYSEFISFGYARY